MTYSNKETSKSPYWKLARFFAVTDVLANEPAPDQVSISSRIIEDKDRQTLIKQSTATTCF
jgi:hypothetical protein